MTSFSCYQIVKKTTDQPYFTCNNTHAPLCSQNRSYFLNKQLVIKTKLAFENRKRAPSPSTLYFHHLNTNTSFTSHAVEALLHGSTGARCCGQPRATLPADTWQELTPLGWLQLLGFVCESRPWVDLGARCALF